MLNFIVTGCGRSGTKFASGLFSRMGMKCTHEKVFGPNAMRDMRPTMHNHPGEASWIAAGVLPELKQPLKGVHIFHQLRNPVAVIRSMMGVGSMTRDSAYRRFIYRVIPHLAEIKDPLLASMHFWVDWNIRTRDLQVTYNRYSCYRVEDLSSSPAVAVLQLNRALDPYDRSQVQGVLASMSTTINHRARDNSVTWDTLPHGTLKDILKRTANLFGYTDEDLENA